MGEQAPSLQVPEAEGGALPAPDIGRPWLSGDWAKWLTAAVLLFVVAGGYWAFSQNHRAKLEQARALAETKRQTSEGEAKAGAGQRAAERAEPVPKRTEPGVQAAAVPTEPPRCLRAQATISRGRIAGQWPGRDPGVTMFMAGEVSASGEAKIRMHAEKPDGTRTVAVDLAGTLKDGRLDATGSFRNGRTATL